MKLELAGSTADRVAASRCTRPVHCTNDAANTIKRAASQHAIAASIARGGITRAEDLLAHVALRLTQKSQTKHA